MIELIILFPVLISSSYESFWVYMFNSSQKSFVLTKPQTLWCSEPSVVPLDYPGAPEANELMCWAVLVICMKLSELPTPDNYLDIIPSITNKVTTKGTTIEIAVTPRERML